MHSSFTMCEMYHKSNKVKSINVCSGYVACILFIVLFIFGKHLGSLSKNITNGINNGVRKRFQNYC